MIVSICGDTYLLNNNKYTKTDRIRKTHDYSYLFKYGNKKYFSAYFILVTRANGKQKNRLGVTVSKKVGNAVTRNRVKRIIKEYFRCYAKYIIESKDVNVIAKKGLGNLDSIKIFYNLDTVFKRLVDRRKKLLK